MRKLKIGILLVVSCLFLTACGCTKEDYKVTFDSNGGSSVSSQTVEKGKTATKPANPTREGYTFGGWYIDINSNNEYNFSTEVTKNITLIAKWVESGEKENTYTITFNVDGGDSVEPVDVKDGKIASLPTPTRSGYNFLGWYNGDKKYEVGSEITGNITLTAKWEKVQSTSNNGGGTTTKKPGNTTKPTKPSKPVDPTPVDPTPVDPTPVDPTPIEDKYTYETVKYSGNDIQLRVLVYKNGTDVTSTVSRVYNSSKTNLGAYDSAAGAPLINIDDRDAVAYVLINGTRYSVTKK